ncbi:MAG: NAD(P)/FAD-dependent oxidoreductase [Burkholderiales bacterium]|nr:NAD(P)/FAD-dependent oxidoreductase [Burkholderiales bacterium]
MLHRLRGLGLSARVLEAGDGVGGTWYWNCYPGARCDVESMQYSYSFDEDLQQEWTWSERYPSQPEILRYINHVADRFDLRRDIQLQTRVQSAVYDEARRLWTVSTEQGERLEARFVISAVGCLSAARVPQMPGLETFSGRWYHTGNWPHEAVDFSGLRVGVIGTGSSGIQTIPAIARQAAQLTVFQRSPNFSIPAWNGPLSAEAQQAWKAEYRQHREKARTTRSGILYEYSTRSALSVSEDERQAEYERRWARGGANFTHAFNHLFFDARANETAAEFVRNKIRGIVRDPAVAALLTPTDHPIGTKRICVDTDYYATYNLPHVKLVSLRQDPIREIVPQGIRTECATHELDAIVFATGYDAVTGALERIDIRGEGGRSLAREWARGPRTYLGLMGAGFPNLFTITGPISPSVFTNVVVSIEQHVDWIADCLKHMQDKGWRHIATDEAAVEGWMAHAQDIASKTLFGQANSWYLGANVPGKPRVLLPYIGGLGNYTAICDEVAADGYRGFQFA